MKGNDSSLPGSLDWLLGYEDGTEIFLREQVVGSCWVRTLEWNVTTQSSKAEIVKWFVPCHWDSALMPLSGLFWHMTHWRNQSGEHMCIFTKAHTILLIKRHTLWGKKSAGGTQCSFYSLKILIRCWALLCQAWFWIYNVALGFMGRKQPHQYTQESFMNLCEYKSLVLYSHQAGDVLPSSVVEWLSATRVCKLPPAPPHSLSFYHSGISPWLQMQLRGCFVPRESSAPNVALGRKNSWSLMARLITLGIKKSWGEGGNSPLLPADLPRQR